MDDTVFNENTERERRDTIYASIWWWEIAYVTMPPFLSNSHLSHVIIWVAYVLF